MRSRSDWHLMHDDDEEEERNLWLYLSLFLPLSFSLSLSRQSLFKAYFDRRVRSLKSNSSLEFEEKKSSA